MKYFPIMLLLLLSLVAPSTQAKKKSSQNYPIPGQVLETSGGTRILLEGNRSLLWPRGSMVMLQGPNAQTLATIDLNATPQEQGGAEAMGLEVEETDLGSAGSSKTYLKGKKKPKGRALNPSAVGTAPAESERGQEKKFTVQGIPMSITRYPNGAERLKIRWGKTTEEAFFDRRQTLVWVQQSQALGKLKYTLKQWSDGSFTRQYQKGSGEVQYTFDAIGQSYRIVFSNPQGQAVAEIHCDQTCEQE